MTEMQKRLLIIGKVWPEPGSSAAGSRMMQLIEFFSDRKYEITFATAAGDSEFAADLKKEGIKTANILLNDKSFDAFVRRLDPQVVLFDRFTSEEQFGWRVAEQCPNALRILDTEDLHCLREARRLALKKNREMTLKDLHNEITRRELASMYRCDLTLIISKYEMDLLKETFKVPEELLHYLPFLFQPISAKKEKSLPLFSERQHFVSIGNFLHEPNFDSVQYLKKSIWPLIRKQLPKAEVHVYGAYPSQKVFELNDKKNGFLVKGRAASVEEVMQTARVCLAPLRFGAGLKGKIADAMLNGTPTVTTRVGAEGMYDGKNWSGAIEDEVQKFADAAVLLHKDEDLWLRSRRRGFVILRKFFSKKAHEIRLDKKILLLQKSTEQHRLKNFTGSLLKHHTALSSKYMAMWIEAKNKLKTQK